MYNRNLYFSPIFGVEGRFLRGTRRLFGELKADDSSRLYQVARRLLYSTSCLGDLFCTTVVGRNQQHPIHQHHPIPPEVNWLMMDNINNSVYVAWVPCGVGLPIPIDYSVIHAKDEICLIFLLQIHGKLKIYWREYKKIPLRLRRPQL